LVNSYIPAAGCQMNVEFGCRHVPRFEVAGKPELLRTLLDQKWHEQSIGLKITVENIPRVYFVRC